MILENLESLLNLLNLLKEMYSLHIKVNINWFKKWYDYDVKQH